jgi:hypothetical protein
MFTLSRKLFLDQLAAPRSISTMSKYKDIFLLKDIFYAGFKKLLAKVRHFNAYYT